MSESADILAAVGRAVTSHVGTILDLSDETKLFYSLQDSSNWCKSEADLPAVVIIAGVPTVTRMMLSLTSVEQEYTIYLYRRSELTEDALSLDMAQEDHNILTELRSIVNDVQHRQWEGLESTDIVVSAISQKSERNHTATEDGVNTVSLFTTSFTIQYDEAY